jgi:hypothetical protein
MDVVFDVVFIIALVAFIKTQLHITGRAVLGIAFLVALFVAFAPIVGGLFPPVAPFLVAIVQTIGLFLAAAGSWDAINGLRAR